MVQIASQARNNHCELYPANYALPAPIPVLSTSTTSRIKGESIYHIIFLNVYRPRSDATTSCTDDSTSSLSRPASIRSAPSKSTAAPIPLAMARREGLDVQPAQTQKRSSSISSAPMKQAISRMPLLLVSSTVVNQSLHSEPVNATAVRRPPKGASLANPNKKARKYQELEFEDDD
jgi:hypothetical protein